MPPAQSRRNALRSDRHPNYRGSRSAWRAAWRRGRLHDDLLRHAASLVAAIAARPPEGYEQRQPRQYERRHRLPISILVHLFAFSFYDLLILRSNRRTSVVLPV